MGVSGFKFKNRNTVCHTRSMVEFSVIQSGYLTGLCSLRQAYFSFNFAAEFVSEKRTTVVKNRFAELINNYFALSYRREVIIIPYYLSSKLLCFPSPRSSSPLSGVDDRAANMDAAEAPVAVFRLLDNMFWSFVAKPTVAVKDWTS